MSTKTKKKKTVKKPVAQDRGQSIRYVGHRPFRVAASDAPVAPGEILDESHAYSKHLAALALRADFEVVNNG